jgi:hypothetical protein
MPLFIFIPLHQKQFVRQPTLKQRAHLKEAFFNLQFGTGGNIIFGILEFAMVH